jgi:hypothetical protein
MRIMYLTKHWIADPERSACGREAATACLGLGVCEQGEHRPAPSAAKARPSADAYGQAAGRAFGSTRTALQS